MADIRSQFYREQFNNGRKSSVTKNDLINILADSHRPFSAMDCLPVSKSLPRLELLDPAVQRALTIALDEGAIEKSYYNTDEGVQTCFRKGWLHADTIGFHDPTVCVYPSRVHERYVQVQDRDIVFLSNNIE